MPSIKENRQSALYSLRLQWAAFATLSVAFLAGGYAFLQARWEPDYAARWLVLPCAGMVYLLVVLWRNLGANQRAGEDQLLPSLGWGNALTLLRGMLVAALLGFLFLPRPEYLLAWIPGLLYTLSDVADFFDGYAARLSNHATRLGEILDMSLDGLGVMAAALLAVQYGQAPGWYLAVAFARMFFVAGLWLRKRLGKPVYDAPHSASRRVFAGLQMGFLAVALWPVFYPPATHIAATLFGLPLLAGFLRDWLAVSGMIRPVRTNASQLQKAIIKRLPFALRLTILGLGLSQFSNWTRALTEQSALLILPGFFLSVAVCFIVLGAAARVSSVLALFGLGFSQSLTGLTPALIFMAVACTGILYMGSGQFSLWRPEDQLFYRRAGERRALDARGQG